MADCVVIGAGAFGSWSALRLRESGHSVLLVEALGAGNPKSSSGAASRVIRLGYGPEEIYTRWAARSLSAWKELFARQNRPELFQPTGMLWTALPGHPHAQGTLATFRKLGVAHEAISADDVRRRYPILRFEHEVVGILEPESGALLASRAVRAVTEESIRAGCQVVAARIDPPGEVEGRLEYIVTEEGRKIAADTFVFACGPWLPKLFPLAVGRRIRVTRQCLCYFDAPGVAMPIWIDFTDARGGYTIPPLAGKGFKLGLDRHGPEFDPDTGSRGIKDTETATARAFLAERFPSLATAPLVESEVCQYENTSNGDFLIDRHPRMANVWLVGGGSGHGFKHGPAVGEYVAAVVNGHAGEARFSWATKSEARERSVY